MTISIFKDRPAAEASRELTRASIAQAIQGYIDGGMEPNDASARLFEEILRDGRGNELLALLGSALVHDIWRQRNMQNRPAEVSKVAPPSRRVDVAALRTEQSLLDGLYKVGGEWVRLGDMTKAICHKAFEQYRASALNDEHNARYFRAMEEVLKDGQKVADCFDDDKLMRLYKRCQP